MNKLIIKTSFIILLACFHITSFAQKKIALLEPRVGNGSTEVNGMEKAMLRGELRKAISEFGDYEAFTRSDIDRMMEEYGFQNSGMVEDSQIKRIGEMSGADFICVSTITKSNEEFYVETYLIDMKSGKIINPAGQYGTLENGRLANMLPVCQSLSKELLGKNKPILEVEKSTYDFGKVSASGGATARFPVKNAGGGTLHITVRYGEEYKVDYPSTLSPGERGEIIVTVLKYNGVLNADSRYLYPIYINSDGGDRKISISGWQTYYRN